MEENANLETDVPATLVLKHKIDGKTPQEYQKSLGFGPTQLTARSETTRRLAQLNDAQLIKIGGVTKPHHCVLRFDEHDRCETVELISVEASTRACESGI